MPREIERAAGDGNGIGEHPKRKFTKGEKVQGKKAQAKKGRCFSQKLGEIDAFVQHRRSAVIRL